MENMILSVSTLPEALHRRIRSDRVRVHEENGTIVLTPISKADDIDLWGLLPEGKFTTEKYLAEKAQEKEIADCTVGLRGILADYDDMSVEKFLERMRSDKELDL